MASDELRTVLSPLLFDEDRAIWTTANSYVFLDDGYSADHIHRDQFSLDLRDTAKIYKLSIHASTLEESILCLDYLLGFQDTHFKVMRIAYTGGDNGDVIAGRPHGLCPFDSSILEKLLQNSERRIGFQYMMFTADHCRTLATSGTKTAIEFFVCDFQDKGAAFVDASAGRKDKTSGPTKFSFYFILAFNNRNLALFLSQGMLYSLELSHIELDSEGSRAVASAGVRSLLFSECDLEDEGAALVESVRQGRGPEELRLEGLVEGCRPFGSIESLVTFMNALRGNDQIERLHLLMIDRQQTRALAAALHENKGLVHLIVTFLELDDIARTELFKAISLHPSLRSLDLEMLPSMQSDLQKRREFTKAVADMLSVNERIEEMDFYVDTFAEGDWMVLARTRLECNKYRKRFPSLQRIGEASTRAAVLATALAKFAHKPYLGCMLLSQNHDIVSSFFDPAVYAQVLAPSRKRSRSSSLGSFFNR
jgi:hypothetical protein